MAAIELGPLLSRLKLDTSDLRRAETAVRDGLGRLRAVFTTAGQDAGKSLDQGIAGGVQKATGRLRDARGGFVKAASDAGLAAGRETAKGLDQGVSVGVQQATGRLRSGSGGLVKAASDAGVAAGRETGKGLNQGVSSAVQQAAGRVRAERGRFVKAGGDIGGEAGRETGRRFQTSLGDALQGLGAFAVARRIFRFFDSAKDSAVEFEAAFAGVRKTVDASDATFAKLEKGIRDLAQTIPATAADIALVAENAGQLGISADNLLDFSRTAIALGETTNLSATEASTALAQLANVTSLPQRQIERLGSALVDLGNKGTSTEKDILDLSLRFAGAGKIAGLTQSQILGIGAAFANVGVDAEAGGTAIQKVLLSITQAVNTGSKQLDVFAEVAGLSASEFARLFREDAAGAFTAFVEGLGRSGQKAGTVLEKLGLADQRLISSFLRVATASGGLRTAIDLSGKSFEENTALQTEFQKRLDTDAAKLQTLSNRFNETKIQIGGIIASGLVPLLDIATRIPTPIIAAAAALAGLAAAGVGIVKVRKILADTADELLKLGRAGQIAVKGFEVLGKAGLIATVITVVGEAVDFLGDKLGELRGHAKPINEVQNSLLDLAEGTVDVNQLLKDAGVLGLSGTKNFEEVARKLDSSEGTISRASGRLLSLLPGFGKVRPAEIFEDLDQALVGLVEHGALDEANKAFEQLRVALKLDPKQAARLFDNYKTAVSQAGTSTRITNAATKDLTETLGEEGEQVGEITDAVRKQFDPLGRLTDQGIRLAQAYKNTGDAIDFFQTQLKQSLGITLGTREATSKYEEAIDDLAASLKENGRTLDLNTAKGRENDRSLRTLIESAEDLIAARVRSGKVASDEASQTRALDQVLRELERKFPGLRSQIEKYRQGLAKIPKNVTTKVAVSIDPRDIRRTLIKAIDSAQLRKNIVGEVNLTNFTKIQLAQGSTPSNPLYTKSVRHEGGPIFHGGGPVRSGTKRAGYGARDVGITAQIGEFMLQAQAASAIGLEKLYALNRVRTRSEAERFFAKDFPRFHMGGPVVIPRFHTGGLVTASQKVTTVSGDTTKIINVNIENPVGRTAEDTLQRQLRNLVYLGVL